MSLEPADDFDSWEEEKCPNKDCSHNSTQGCMMPNGCIYFIEESDDDRTLA